MLLQLSVMVYHNRNRYTFFKRPQPIIIYLLDMAETIPREIIVNTLKNRDLLHEERILILFGFTGDRQALFTGDIRIILPVDIQPGNLPPVHLPVLIRFTVKHIRVDPADGKTPVINPAPVVFQIITRTCIVVLCPQRIPGDIERAVLVTEFRIRCGFKCSRIDLPDCVHIPVEQEDVPVERPGAAFCTTGAPEPDFFNHGGVTLCGVLKEAVPLLCQCGNAERDGYKRNRDHQPDLYEDIAVVGYGFLPRFFLWNAGCD